MRIAQADVLIVPGWTNSGPDHWQSRWQRKLTGARRVEQADWDRPLKTEWVETLCSAVAAATRPVVLIAHSLGVSTVAHAAPLLPPGRIAGAFLVAPPDLDSRDEWPAVHGGFAPPPLAPLPFPGVLIASTDDPWCTYDRAAFFARAWRVPIVSAGNAGHINTASGQGPWPEGSMQLAWFLKDL